jgi:CubicO group peptidase (beta-lactamase class C family)
MRTSAFLIIIINLWCLPFAGAAQTIAVGQPLPASVDASRLRRIDTLFNEYVQKGWITGAVTIIIKDNHLVQYKGYGYADADSKKTMASDAIFRIMSQTKGITSVAIMMLYEQGKLYLDEPISHFIPSFKNQSVINTYNAADTSYTTVPAKREVTFRDLLTHSSGIDYSAIGSERMKAVYAKAGIPSGLGYFDADLKERMSALGKLPLAFQPGEKWQYGLNTDLLGCLVEIISGMSLEEFFNKKIFQPLGMKDTYFTVPAAKSNRLPTVYTEDSLHHIIKWSKTFRNIDPVYPTMQKSYFSGGAGLSSTAFDYAVFLQMLLNKGKYNGVQILSPRTVEMMISPQLDFLINARNTFGLGFELTGKKASYAEVRNEGSFGWGGYYGTTYWADPKANLVCLYMTQHTPNTHWELERKFEQLVYQALKQ